jgi:hypothetical protein
MPASVSSISHASLHRPPGSPSQRYVLHDIATGAPLREIDLPLRADLPIEFVEHIGSKLLVKQVRELKATLGSIVVHSHILISIVVHSLPPYVPFFLSNHERETALFLAHNIIYGSKG